VGRRPLSLSWFFLFFFVGEREDSPGFIAYARTWKTGRLFPSYTVKEPPCGRRLEHSESGKNEKREKKKKKTVGDCSATDFSLL
jgi:hypothetical protein